MTSAMFLTCLSLLVSKWSPLTKGDDDIKCRDNAVVMAMTTCQGERQKLSYASQANNTSQLCKALQQYSNCMKPRVQGCQGPAKLAFDVISSKYTSDPYNCRLEESPTADLPTLKQQNDKAPASKDTISQPNTNLIPKDNTGTNKSVTNSGTATNDMKESNNVKAQGQHPYSIHTPALGDADSSQTTSQQTKTTVRSSTTSDSRTGSKSDNVSSDLSDSLATQSRMNPYLAVFVIIFRLTHYLQEIL